MVTGSILRTQDLVKASSATPRSIASEPACGRRARCGRVRDLGPVLLGAGHAADRRAKQQCDIVCRYIYIHLYETDDRYIEKERKIER